MKRMKQQVWLVLGVALALLTWTRAVLAEGKVFSYNTGINYLNQVTVPQGRLLVGQTGQVKPLENSVIAGLEYAFVYNVSDPSILSIDAKGNWVALKEGSVTLEVAGQVRDGSPEFEAELDGQGIRRATTETAVGSYVDPFKIEVVKMQSIPVYRLYDKKTGEYAYTISSLQVDQLKKRGWQSEGVAWMTDKRLGQGIYRLYNSKQNRYFYTRHTTEYQLLQKRGWQAEGYAFYSHGNQPIYRFHKNGKHIYTKNEKEKALLTSRGYRNEGIAWYSQP